MTSRRRQGLAALAVLAVGALLSGRVVPGEVGTAQAVNGLPSPVIDALEVFMQLGARPAIVLVAVVAAVVAPRRRWRVVAAVVLAGVLGWLGSHVVKDVVERPRPTSLGAEVVVRDDSEGHAYPSTHVSIATASLSALALSTQRPSSGALAGGAVVGLGRMAVGVHLPIDVIGGLGLGLAAGVVAVELLDRP